MKKSVVAVAAFAFLSAAQAYAAHAADQPTVVELSATQATQRQTEMWKGGPPDLSVVYIARLKFGDQQVDVTSIRPSLVSQVATRSGPLLSLVRFSTDRKSLELLSRDPTTGGGKFLSLSTAVVPMTVTFPVLTNGKLVDTQIALLLVTHKP